MGILFIILSYIAIMGVFLVFPIVTIVQTWTADKSKSNKIMWTIFIVITWSFLAIASFIFALIRYKGAKKLIPIALIVVGALSFVGLMANMNSLMDLSTKPMEMSLNDSISKGNYPSEVKQKLLSDIGIINYESSDEGQQEGFMNGLETSNKKIMLLSYMNIITMDQTVTEQEFSMWNMIMEKRNELDPVQLQNIITSEILSVPNRQQPKN